MKSFKITIKMAAVAAITVTGYQAYKTYFKPEQSTMLMQNIEALSQDEEPYPEERLNCISQGGNWNMASVCDDSGFESVTCTISGEVNVFGVKLSGSYNKGQSYRIPWARYKCQDSNGNCCKQQGLYSGDTKLA